jgi:xanthine dehydrogenase accessory factor
MLVTSTGLYCGTVGGGRVEAQAIAAAQEMLAKKGIGSDQPRFRQWSLRGDAGMTCGGAVKLYLEPHPAGGAAWTIGLFGAGHIAQALLPVLLPLPCAIRCYDTRREWLDRLPPARNLVVTALTDPAAAVDSLPDGAFVLCMTQGHKTDRPILLRALAARRFPFVGVIGSEAKATILRRELIADGLAPELAGSFQCPVGLPFGSNHPHEIAISIAAQLIGERDRVKTAAGEQVRPQPTGDAPKPVVRAAS